MKKKKTPPSASKEENEKMYDQFTRRMKELHPLNTSGRPSPPPTKPRVQLTTAPQQDEATRDAIIDEAMSRFKDCLKRGLLIPEDVPTRAEFKKLFDGKPVGWHDTDHVLSNALDARSALPIVSRDHFEKVIDRMMELIEANSKWDGHTVEGLPSREDLTRRYWGKGKSEDEIWEEVNIILDKQVTRLCILLDEKEIQKSRNKGKDKKEHEFLLFFSYAQRDTSAEATIFFKDAKARFPDRKIFRDMDTSFKLNELIQHVSSSKNVVVLLSENYPKRPFTLIELHHALAARANICTVIVTRQGMKPFDFEQVKLDIKSGNVAGYLDEDGWDLLREHGMTVRDVEKDLQTVMNVVGVPFSVENHGKVQDAMMGVVFDRLVL
jgi:hypothetical protein